MLAGLLLAVFLRGFSHPWLRFLLVAGNGLVWISSSTWPRSS